jgi:hypothetical protein
LHFRTNERSLAKFFASQVSANGAADTVFPTLFGVSSQETKAVLYQRVWPNEKMSNPWNILDVGACVCPTGDFIRTSTWNEMKTTTVGRLRPQLTDQAHSDGRR